MLIGEGDIQHPRHLLQPKERTHILLQGISAFRDQLHTKTCGLSSMGAHSAAGEFVQFLFCVNALMCNKGCFMLQPFPLLTLLLHIMTLKGNFSL